MKRSEGEVREQIDLSRRTVFVFLLSNCTSTDTENQLQNLEKKKKNPCRFIFSLRGLLILQLFCSIKPVISYLGFA